MSAVKVKPNKPLSSQIGLNQASPLSPKKKHVIKEEEHKEISSAQLPMKKYFGDEPPTRKKKKSIANKDIRKERFSYN